MKDMILPILIGTATGALAGCGVGGGTLLLLFLTAVQGASFNDAKWINLLFFIVTAAVSLTAHIKNKLIIGRATLICALSGTVAAAVFAYFSRSLPEAALRVPFALLFITVGVKEVLAKERRKGE